MGLPLLNRHANTQIKRQLANLSLLEQKVTVITPKPRISRTKGHLSKRTAFVREIVKEVAGLAPYERRVIELLRNSKDKRARKLAKKRVCSTPHTFGFYMVLASRDGSRNQRHNLILWQNMKDEEDCSLPSLMHIFFVGQNC
jgi:hypothetical protein